LKDFSFLPNPFGKDGFSSLITINGTRASGLLPDGRAAKEAEMETQVLGGAVPRDDSPADERQGDDFDPPVTPPTNIVDDPKAMSQTS
jgi:hypothetical protein